MERPPIPLSLVTVKSPKSIAFPVVIMVTYAITLLTVGVDPPAHIPRVGYAADAA